MAEKKSTTERLNSTEWFIHLVRPHFDSYPNYCLSTGYSIRFFRSGDITVWLRIYQEVYPQEKISPDFHGQEFGNDIDDLANRQLFLCNENGKEIGTITARIDPNYLGSKWGYIGWLAIVPPYQRQGLAKPLVSAVMDCLSGLGCTRAYSTIALQQVVAIQLFLRFGFLPVVRDHRDETAWDSIRLGLIQPDLRFQSIRE